MGAWRQLDLLKGPRQRGVRPKASPEFAVHCMIADALRISAAPGWLWFHVPNGELRDKVTAGRLKRMGVRPGVSDFLLVAPGQGRLYALELKRRGLGPTEQQDAFLEAVRAAGGVAEWTDTFDGALAILASWGAITTRLRVSA